MMWPPIYLNGSIVTINTILLNTKKQSHVNGFRGNAISTKKFSWRFTQQKTKIKHLKKKKNSHIYILEDFI